MTNIKYLIFLILVMLSLSHCSGLYESKKQNKSDEFLVEKKSPLIMPPEYNKLPLPKNEKNKKNLKNDNIKLLIKSMEKKVFRLDESSSKRIFNLLQIYQRLRKIYHLR